MDIRKAGLFLWCLVLIGFPSLATAEPKVAQVGRSHYTGTWLEIARTPMFITDGCVAGFTTYRAGKRSDEVSVVDGCYEGVPSGKLKTVNGKGRLSDATTTRAKLRVRYPFLITFDYWVLYTSPDKSWFISADPKLKHLWIYSRTVPSRKALSIMVRKAQTLGYDVGKLEFPPAR
ncbi:MAG: lipocalin family protein [Hyphomicrobiales bacterium]|nr:lipocalin family protein [Hyphomicrobiales bacterium]